MILGALLVFGAMFAGVTGKGKTWPNRSHGMNEGALVQVLRVTLLGLCLAICPNTSSQTQTAQLKPVPRRLQGNGYCVASADFGPADTPLMTAIWRGNIAYVEAHINSGTGLNILVPLDCDDGRGKAQTTPLLNAIEANSFSRFREHSKEMVEWLLQHGADPNFHAPNGPLPLQTAALHADLFSIKTLLRHNANLDGRDGGGETAFLIAAQQENSAAVIEELVRAGANVNLTNEYGSNAVALSAWRHHLENVKQLFRLGVDPCAKNNSGETAMDMAKTNLNDDPGKQEIISFLQEKCGR